MTKIYLDMDGVIADFDKSCLKLGYKNRQDFLHRPYSEWTEDEKKLDLQIRSAMATPGFWMNLPLMKDAYKLWEACAEHGHSVLTAYPFKYEGADIQRVKDEKWVWLTDRFGPFSAQRFICCNRPDKKLHARRGRILIDDSVANCQEWEDAGGTAILFTDASKAIKELDKLV